MLFRHKGKLLAKFVFPPTIIMVVKVIHCNNGQFITIKLPPCIRLKEQISDLMKGFLSFTSYVFIYSDVCESNRVRQLW